MQPSNKRNAAGAGWRRLATDYPFENRHFRLRCDRVRVGEAAEIEFAYLETRGAVWVVPVTAAGEIVLIRQYRYAVDEWLWEVPAGGLFDHEGEPESLARRELAEEVGGTADRFQYLGWFFGGAAVTDTRCHLFVAHGTRLTGQPSHEPTETIHVHCVPLAEALRMARSGEMKDGRSALALLWSEPFLRAAAGVSGEPPDGA
jgi:ADP-ribose pyrophosphatase